MRNLSPLSAIDPRERIRPAQLLLGPIGSKSMARSHLRRVKARPALVPAPAMGRLRMVHGKSESRYTIARWTKYLAEAERFRALKEQTHDPFGQHLFAQMERSYRTLAECDALLQKSDRQRK